MEEFFYLAKWCEIQYNEPKGGGSMKNKTGKKILYYVILAVLLGVFCFSGYKIYSYYSEQNASTKLNEEIVREYTIRKTGEAKEYFEVDFDQLRQQNEDVTAWLYLPDSVINYPVLQHGDNDYYLTRQIDGSYNKNGSIFMDYRNASDFSDRNTIIYGHHMRTGNMFGKLVNFKSDSYYQEHDHMFIMMPQVTYRLDLLCGAVVEPDDPIYAIDPTEEALAACMRRSTFQTKLDLPGEEARLVTLSTCSYEFADARYIVIGVLTPLEETVKN
jgi:sortase B